MENTIEKLRHFNFTRIEAQVYLCLLKNGRLNGSQIAKYLGISRTSIYTALDNLYEKGHIFMLAGEPTMYMVQDPDLLIKNIKKNYSEAIEVLERSLNNFDIYDAKDQYWNVKGYDNFLINTKKMLLQAEDEVYISTTFPLQLFRDELNILLDREVRIVVFSFERLDREGIAVEFYCHEEKNIYYEGRRWMMVVDNKLAFIANENPNKEVLGTFTENPLMISIIAEHIHHDIYLLKLKEKYGRNLFAGDILIDSKFEKRTSLKNK